MKDILNALSRRVHGLSSSKAAAGSSLRPRKEAPATPAQSSSTTLTILNTLTPVTVQMSPLNKVLPALPSSTLATTTATAEPAKNDNPLFDMDKLGIQPEHRQWFAALNTSISRFGDVMDPSHDYQQVRRIVSNAATILLKECEHNEWARNINPLAIWVACMIQDVSNMIYRDAGQSWAQTDVVDAFLEPLGCPAAIRQQAGQIIASVPYAADITDEEGVKAVTSEIHEFRIVQDAIHLDELGAFGVSRLFFFSDGNGFRQQGLVGDGVRLVEERFARYPRLMKTDTGREMAEERYRWMVDGFARRWVEERDTSNV